MIRYTGNVSEELWLVLRQTWKRPQTLQSDFTRRYAREFALAASMGLISIIHPDGHQYGYAWHITTAGLMALEHKENLL